MQVLTRYDHDLRDRPKRDFRIKKDSNKKVLNPEVVSLTKQSEREASDINTIVAKAKKTGVLGSGLPAQRKAQYGDFSNPGDFLEQQNRVAKFKELFDGLSAEIRNKFQNRPDQLLAFVNNPENKKECIELGLLPKPVVTRQQDGDYTVILHDGIEADRILNKPAPTKEAAPASAPDEPTPTA